MAKLRSNQEIELNLTSMLDMGFNLLAFFIITFKPLPIEGQISLRLPPPQAIKGATGAPPPGQNIDNNSPVEGVNTLIISVFSNPRTGMIESMGVGETPVPSIAALTGKLKEVFSDPGNPFDQVIIQVTESCRYDELMKVIEVCSKQVLADGQKLSKLSFVAIPSS